VHAGSGPKIDQHNTTTSRVANSIPNILLKLMVVALVSYKSGGFYVTSVAGLAPQVPVYFRLDTDRVFTIGAHARLHWVLFRAEQLRKWLFAQMAPSKDSFMNFHGSCGQPGAGYQQTSLGTCAGSQLGTWVHAGHAHSRLLLGSEDQ
jgi:hypothetical protein